MLEQGKLLSAIRELLHINYNLKVTKIKRGSVLMTIELKKKDALELLILNFIGKLNKLNSYGVLDIFSSDYTHMKIDDILNEYNKLEKNPLIDGKREEGKIVFIDENNGYGIIHRKLGGYLKFILPEGRGARGLGRKVSFDIELNKIGAHIIDRGKSQNDWNT